MACGCVDMGPRRPAQLGAVPSTADLLALPFVVATATGAAAGSALAYGTDEDLVDGALVGAVAALAGVSVAVLVDRARRG